jgi:hypothetical protein
MTDIVRSTLAILLTQTIRVSSTPIPPFGYGIDLVCQSALDPYLAETDPTTIESLSQDCFHRITTKRGSIVDAPDFGIDIRSILSTGQTPQALQALQGQIESELLKDDRVVAAVAVVTGAGTSYLIKIAITPQDSRLAPFNLIVSVTDGDALLAAINQSPS